MKKYAEVTIMMRGSSAFKEDYTAKRLEHQVAGGSGWFAQEWGTLPDRTSYTGFVRMGAHGVYINGYLLNTLAADEARHYPVVATEGRTKWYSFTNTDLQERLAFHIKYPPRSETEARIRERTREIVNWLLRVVGDWHDAAAAEAAAK